MPHKFLLIAFYLVSNTLGLFLIKHFFSASKQVALFSMAALTSPKLIIGAILYASSFLTWLWLLSKEDLSSIYPVVVGLGYLSIMLVSFIFLKEQVSAAKFIGAFLILVGVFFILRAGK
jgi:multidrug transporter EmrE-like cation transporter